MGDRRSRPAPRGRAAISPLASLPDVAVLRRLTIGAGLLLLLLSALFVAFPEIDIATSALFYDRAGPDPYWLWYPDWRPALVRSLATFIEGAAMVLVLLPLLGKLLRPDRAMALAPRAILFAVATFLVGVVLLVDVLLKGHWGRARPRYVPEFHPDLILLPTRVFSRAWEIGESCRANCSFVSSEAAAAAWLVGLALVAPSAWRLPAALAGALVYAAAAWARVATGGHFLSDVAIAGALMLLVAASVGWLIAARLPPSFDAKAEHRLARIGRRLRGQSAAPGL